MRVSFCACILGIFVCINWANIAGDGSGDQPKLGEKTMPNAKVRDLDYDSTSDTLLVGLQGRRGVGAEGCIVAAGTGAGGDGVGIGDGARSGEAKALTRRRRIRGSDLATRACHSRNWGSDLPFGDDSGGRI